MARGRGSRWYELSSFAEHGQTCRLAISPTCHLSDRPFLRQPISPTSHFSDKPSVRQAICPTSNLSDKPFLQQAICPTVYLSNKPLVRQAICPTGHWSDWFIWSLYIKAPYKSETPYGAKHLPKANLGLLPALVYEKFVTFS